MTGRILGVALLSASIATGASSEVPWFDLQTLPLDGANASRAHDVCAHDDVVATGEVLDSARWRPALWTLEDGAWILDRLPLPIGASGDVFANSVCRGFGSAVSAVGVMDAGSLTPQPILWEMGFDGGIEVSVLPHLGLGSAVSFHWDIFGAFIAGWTQTAIAAQGSGARVAALWLQEDEEVDPVLQQLRPLIPGGNGEALDATCLNGEPTAVGFSQGKNGLGQPMLWTRDAGIWQGTALPMLPGGERGEAHAISDPGEPHAIVGWTTDDNEIAYPVRWTSTDGTSWQIELFEPVGVGSRANDVAGVDTSYIVGDGLGAPGAAAMWFDDGSGRETVDLNTRVIGNPPSVLLESAAAIALGETAFIVGLASALDPGAAGALPQAYVLTERRAVSTPFVESDAMFKVRPVRSPSARPAVAVTLQHPAEVSLRVFDVTGRQLASIAPQPLAAGGHTLGWPGDVGRGVTFVEVTADGQTVSTRVVVNR